MNTELLEQAQKLPLNEQLELVEALWDQIARYNPIPLTRKQEEELDRRLKDLEADPEDVIGWDEVKASALARIGR